MKKLFAYCFLILATLTFVVMPFVTHAQTVSLTEYQPGQQIPGTEQYGSSSSDPRLKVPDINSTPETFYSFVKFKTRSETNPGSLYGDSVTQGLVGNFRVRNIQNQDGSTTRIHFDKAGDKLVANDVVVAVQKFDKDGKLQSLYVADGIVARQNRSQNKVTFAGEANDALYKQAATISNANQDEFVKKITTIEREGRDTPENVQRRTASQIIDMYCRTQDGKISTNGYLNGYKAYIAQNNLPDDDDCQSYGKYINDLYKRANTNPLGLTNEERTQLIADGVLNPDGTAPTNPADSRANATAKAINDVAAIGTPMPVASMVGLTFCNPIWGWDTAKCIAGIVNLVLDWVSAILVAAVAFFDFVLNFTVVALKTHVDGTLETGIQTVWTLIKGLSNLLFIAGLLYIAIKTILQGDGFQEKRTLKNIIICAVLINFSMFFTRLLIDVSNVPTIKIYSSIVESANASGAKAPELHGARTSPLSAVIMNKLKITSFYTEGNEMISPGSIATRGLLSIIFVLVAAAVFAATAIMFTIRFFIIIFLLMTSPIGFVKGIFPAIDSYPQKWWKALTDNLVFMPVYMLTLYMAMTFLTFTTNIPHNADYSAIIFAFSITIIAMLACLIVAKSAGGNAGAADWGTKLARGAIGGMTFGLAARAGRRGAMVAGWGANKVGAGKFARSLAASNSLIGRSIGRNLVKAGDKVQNATFDARNLDAAKNLGLGKGLDMGAAKYKEEKKKEDEKALKAYKADFELSGKDKAKADARAELHDQAERAKKRQKEVLEAEKKADTEVTELESKVTNVIADVDTAILKEKEAITKEIDANDKEIARLTAAITAGTASAAEITEEGNRRAQKSHLETKRNDIGSNRADRVREEKDRLDTKLIDAKKDQKSIKDKVFVAEENVREAQERITDFGYDPAKLKDQVTKDKEEAKERKKKYITHLEAGSLNGFSSTGKEVHREELIKELKNLYKSKEDDEMKKLLDAIKERTKDEDKK